MSDLVYMVEIQNYLRVSATAGRLVLKAHLFSFFWYECNDDYAVHETPSLEGDQLGEGIPDCLEAKPVGWEEVYLIPMSKCKFQISSSSSQNCEPTKPLTIDLRQY
jgi:hypothetical protein